MGLRCSLFGHDFDEPAIERDREERGAEVVITVREVKTCRRCGAEQIVAENTEVRHASAGQPGTKIPEPEQEADALDETNREGPPDQEPGKDGAQPSVESERPEPETPDISQYVDSAEEDSGRGGRPEPTTPDSTEAAGAEADEPTVDHEDAEVEILDSEDESSAAENVDEADLKSEPPVDAESESPVDAGPEAETASTDEGDMADEITDDSFEEGSDEAQADEPEPDDDEKDDAIILDNDDGQDERASDIGRRELAGTGNMFDASAPENDDSGSPTEPRTEPGPSERVEPESGEDEAEGVPEEAEPTEDADGISQREPWPDEERLEEDSPRDDPAFQFGHAPDRTDEGESERYDEPDAGFTSAGSVDVTGSSEDSSPSALECPECGYQATFGGTSLRAGDICPECHGGYLAERR